ncbi:hypothetical protein [Mesorhizobium sp. M0139]|uniref:phage adaptor protein n=1 Tax=Mesorhizobium sp. M0139 TaxID=2956892 RepID=UPI003336D6FD
MARGATLLQLISDLRDELRRANSPAAGPDDTGPLRRTINHVYATLYASHNWPHLLTYFDRVTLNAGQRYYDVPTGLDYERIIEVRNWWNGIPEPIERGISFDDYMSYDSTADVRSSPVLKWDVRFTGDREQIEYWPLPDTSTQAVQFVGMWAYAPLVNDTDTCRLDSDIIVLYAAAELLPDTSPDKKAKLQLGQELLRLAKVRSSSGAGKTFQLGLGEASSRRPSEAVVRVR